MSHLCGARVIITSQTRLMDVASLTLLRPRPTSGHMHSQDDQNRMAETVTMFTSLFTRNLTPTMLNELRI